MSHPELQGETHSEGVCNTSGVVALEKFFVAEGGGGQAQTTLRVDLGVGRDHLSVARRFLAADLGRFPQRGRRPDPLTGP